jgi:deoxyribonuclease-4
MDLPGTFDALHIGTAGLPHEGDKRIDYAKGLALLKKAGLSALELEFVHQVHLDLDRAAEVGILAAERGIHLSAHAPYYVNLASLERPKVHASVSRILKAAKSLQAAGGHSVVFHAAFYQGRPADEVYTLVAKAFEELETALAKAEVSVWVRPELTGKPTQFGDPDELIRLSREFETVLPCIDFSHLHARTDGAYNTVAEWKQLLDAIEGGIPKEKQVMRRMHMHLSGIEYGPKGERRHLPLAESDLEYSALMRLLKKRGVCGTLICEAPRETLIADTLLLKEAYSSA